MMVGMGVVFIWLGIAVVGLLPFILALISILTKKVSGEEKLLWCLIITLAGWVGQLIYLAIGRKQLKELETKGGVA
ncbi:MAG: PLDc N-terminal domain-containing protein [Defluviitaleaceae bacterium]|nr:PLDc N-terminal domain-containing protein [Defluviitaleaceae bacterium]